MKKSRHTRQRAVIVDILRQCENHPTAEAIYREARKILPNISLGTVYRNLNFLREQGLVHEVRANSDSSSRFEGDRHPHAHFHCTCCKTVHDLPLPDCLKDVSWAGGAPVATVASLELHIVGSCNDCSAATAN